MTSACKRCLGTGMVFTETGSSVCSCQQPALFKTYLASVGILLGCVIHPDKRQKEFKDIVSAVKKDGRQALFYGGPLAANYFYSIMYDYLKEHSGSVKVLSSSDITSMLIDKKPILWDHIGVSLGFDITTNVHEKSVLSFAYSRKAFPGRTFYFFPFSRRRLDSMYPEVFSELHKNREIALIEV